MRFRSTLSLLVGLFLVTGCTSFDASDEGDSKSVLLGKTFTVSLPFEAKARVPQIMSPGIARFLECRPDPTANLDTFEFKATSLGTTEIHIPKTPAPSTGTTTPSTSATDFVITIKVVIGGSNPY